VAGFFVARLPPAQHTPHHLAMTSDQALFPGLLGDHWHQLAIPVQCMHGDAKRVLARGAADVEGATHLPARCLRRLLGLPEPGLQQALEVMIERNGTRETWTRRFALGQMRSVLDRVIDTPLLREQLGPITLRFELLRDDNVIDWRLSGARIFGLPLPRALFGEVLSRSGERDGRYTFDIDTRLPLFGRLIAYRGWLEIVDGN
jgi:Domain of unknown function (DUF4166)